MLVRPVLLWLLVLAGGCLGSSSPSGPPALAHNSLWQTRTFPAPSLNPPFLAEPSIDQRASIFIRPATATYRGQRAGLLEVRPPAHLPYLGPPLTQIFYQKLMEQRPFREVVLLPQSSATLEAARELGRKWQVDLLILAECPLVLDGGGVGTAALQVDLKVMEAESGQLLWYLSDAMQATPRPVIDLIVTETRPYPTPDIFYLAAVLARRLCQTLAAGCQATPP